MANWAIVIGIDQYWTPNATLRGAVSDALKMRDWLLSPTGGNVLPQNLFLLLGPALSSKVPSGVPFSNADQATIIGACQLLARKSGGRGDRLFFHYSGHGLAVRVNNLFREDAVIPVDFTDALPIRSLGLRSITEFFQATQIRNQFFFIDACRNMPWEGTKQFRIGEMPSAPEPDPTLPPVQQFVFHATSPGVKAAEISEAGNERGAFTEALLDGLRGRGRAKAWDRSSEGYIVRVGRLLTFLVDEVSKKVSKYGYPDLIQIPQEDGQRGAIDRIDGSDPILARFPADAFQKEALDISLEPEVVVSQAKIDVKGDEVADSRAAIAESPVRFLLPPQDYTVTGSALNFVPERKRLIVELYDAQSETMRFRPIPPAPQAPEPAPMPPPPQAPEPTARGSGELRVTSADRMATLELADSTGKVLKTGLGSLEYDNLPDGLYRARLRTPEGRFTEKLVELPETSLVELDSPEPRLTAVTSDIIKRFDFKRLPDKSLEVSKSVGPISSAPLSTILTLAGSVSTFEGFDLSAARLRGLGLSAFREAQPDASASGLQILFGVESESGHDIERYFGEMRIRVWPQGHNIPQETGAPSVFSRVKGLAAFTLAADAKPHWLSIEFPGQQSVVLAITMMPARLTLLVFHLDAAGLTRIFQYLPPLQPRNKIESPGPKDLRRLELIQRFYMSGRLDYALENVQAEDLLYAKWIEPIAGCLGVTCS